MEGQVVSHYRVLQRIGGGGMGVVYKAEDSHLNRSVALKFLPPNLTTDPEARERFVQEAQAASALDHPNICTIHDIDSAAGQLFIAMAYYDGQTLKRRLESADEILVSDALDYAIQVCRGLERAHSAGIVHRDIKPANLMLTATGLVKILDFGVAKLVDNDRTSLTRLGTTVGTVAYMAPEQLRGETVDRRADLWAVGVVLYEMLARRQPFRGDNEFAVMNAIASQEPGPVAVDAQAVPDTVVQILRRALAKQPTDRYQSAAAMIHDLQRSLDQLAARVVPSPIPLKRGKALFTATALGVLVGAIAVAGWMVNRTVATRRLDTSLARLSALADEDQFMEAVRLAEELERSHPNDPRLTPLWERVAIRRSVNSEPEGASVWVREALKPDAPWKLLGQTPLVDVRLPGGSLRWRLEKEGFEPIEALATFRNTGAVFRLTERGGAPSGMLWIPGAALGLPLIGYPNPLGQATLLAGDFLVDRHEVTNAEFKKFVDSGGYAKQEPWKQPFVDDGRRLSWAEAMPRFVDRTGRPGPSTWAAGTYPNGQSDYPVSGVSWYEAAAFAEFSGKSLPTVYHWARAASVPQASSIVPLSNLQGKAPAAVGSFAAVSQFGISDMAGNVKEWCWNEVEGTGGRFLLGGAWSEPVHMFQFVDGRSPFDRSEANGFRLVKYAESPSAALRAPVATPTPEAPHPPSISDDVFQAYRELYRYDDQPLDAKVTATVDEGERWTRETLSFRAVYGNERITAHLFLPKGVSPPYQTIVYFPGAGAVSTRVFTPNPDVEFLITSGRALLYPIYKGTYERNTGQSSVWPELSRAYAAWQVEVTQDALRSIDYLVTRADIDASALGYFGLSWGAYLGSRVLALEPRLKAAVFLAGGAAGVPTSPVGTGPLDFAPRVRVPVLMLNGTRDHIFPVDLAQKPLFASLGTAPRDKRHVVHEGGHVDFGNNRNQIIRESLDWLDRYLGPVSRQ